MSWEYDSLCLRDLFCAPKVNVIPYANRTNLFVYTHNEPYSDFTMEVKNNGFNKLRIELSLPVTYTFSIDAGRPMIIQS